MPYKIKIHPKADKIIERLDKVSKKQILNYIYEVIPRAISPRSLGKALVGNHSGRWRYRTGHFRIICEIMDEELVILVIDVGHRKDIY